MAIAIITAMAAPIVYSSKGGIVIVEVVGDSVSAGA